MKRIIILCGCLLFLPLALLMAWSSLRGDFVGNRIVKQSPDGEHTAEMIQIVLKDSLRYRVKLDGEHLFSTRRFDRRTTDYREALVWNNASDRFYFEVGGQRLEGWEVDEGRKLTPEERFAIEPEEFFRLGYRGRVSMPGENPVGLSTNKPYVPWEQ